MGLCFAFAQKIVEIAHELGGCSIIHAPQCSQGGSRPSCQKGAAEALNAFPFHEAAPLCFASRQGGQLHAVQFQCVDFIQEQILATGEQQAGAIRFFFVGRSMRGNVQDPCLPGLRQIGLIGVRTRVDLNCSLQQRTQIVGLLAGVVQS